MFLKVREKERERCEKCGVEEGDRGSANWEGVETKPLLINGQKDHKS